MVGIGVWLTSAALADALPKKVGKELSKACERGETSACVELAEKLLDPGIAKVGHGPEAAAPWAKRACDREVHRGCHLQGLTLEATLTRRRQLDGRRIVRWYADACDAGSSEACHDLDRFLGDWETELALQEDEVRFMVSMACAGGVDAACEEDHELVPSGPLTGTVITSIMRASFPEVQACSDRGAIKASFAIDGEGRVTDLALAPDPGERPGAEVLACVTQRVEGLRFPIPKRPGVQVSYLYRFAP